ncbi:MAG: hypothetical protein ACYDAO_08570 [Thermoplasmataceae archaeon]
MNINSKLKKIGAVGIIVIIALASITYYEDATEPNGIYHTMPDIPFPQPNTHRFSITDFKNYTYLGNRITLAYTMHPSPLSHIVNLSDPVQQCNVAQCTFHSRLCLPQLSSIHGPYSNLVVTVTNISVSLNRPFFKNGTNKNDSFGPYGQYTIQSGSYVSSFCLYEFGDLNGGNIYYKAPPLDKVINTGNFTFYENITFTVTLSLGILHFTSQPYHFDASWWILYGYNLSMPNGVSYLKT